MSSPKGRPTPKNPRPKKRSASNGSPLGRIRRNAGRITIAVTAAFLSLLLVVGILTTAGPVVSPAPLAGNPTPTPSSTPTLTEAQKASIDEQIKKLGGSSEGQQYNVTIPQGGGDPVVTRATPTPTATPTPSSTK